MYFYVPFSFFKVHFNFVFLAKAAFCKDRAHRGSPKRRKNDSHSNCKAKVRYPQRRKNNSSFFLESNGIFYVFLRAISFFKSLFQFCFRCKSSILQVLSAWGYPKRRKMSFLFFCNQTAFFLCIFMGHFIFSKSLSILPAFQKQHFTRIKSIGVPQKEEKCHFFFL